jgi:hypothetical protein
MPRAASDAKGCTKGALVGCGHFAPTLEKFSALVCLMALRSAWAAVTLPMPFSPRPANSRRLFAWLTFLVAWNSDRALA